VETAVDDASAVVWSTFHSKTHRSSTERGSPL
jgi:hypothetical protein